MHLVSFRAFVRVLSCFCVSINEPSIRTFCILMNLYTTFLRSDTFLEELRSLREFSSMGLLELQSQAK